MNHCLAQVFSGGLPPRLPEREFVSRSVVFQNLRVIHGDIRRPLIEVTYRIATRGHHIAQQLVRGHYRTGGAVNEARLDVAPGRYEACTIACRERPDAKPFDSLCALVERGFRMPPVAAFLHGASIFGATELSAQSCSPAFSVQKERDEACNEDHDESNGQA